MNAACPPEPRAKRRGVWIRFRVVCHIYFLRSHRNFNSNISLPSKAMPYCQMVVQPLESFRNFFQNTMLIFRKQMVYVRGFIFKTPYNPRKPGFHPWNPLNVQIHLTRNRLRLFLARFSCTQRNASWFETARSAISNHEALLDK